MLNELLIMERGARQGGIPLTPRHPEIKDAGQKPTLRVRLGAAQGEVVGIDPVPKGTALWSLGRGNKLRFPFVQPNAPLLLPSETEVERLSSQIHRERLLAVFRSSDFNERALSEWPGVRGKNGNWSQKPDQYLDALQQWRNQLRTLCNTDGRSVVAVIDRFRAACEMPNGGADLLRKIANLLIMKLDQTSGTDWLKVSRALLVDGGAALYFDVPSDEFPRGVGDPRQIGAISAALESAGSSGGGPVTCSLTGTRGERVKDTFPELVLPVIGRTIVFSRFGAIPSNCRYRQFGADSFAVDQGVCKRLVAALRSLTTPDRKNVTWCSVPGEAPKLHDLMLAFVEWVPDAPAAGALTEESEDDLSAETPTTKTSDGVAAFEKRTERLIEAIKARVGADFRKTAVRLAVFRKVDPANRKVVYAGTPTVGDLYDAAMTWIAGERNVPAGLTLNVGRKGERAMAPPHIAPLGVIAFSKQLFLRNGERPPGKKTELVGLSAAEAFGLFLDNVKSTGDPAGRRIRRALRLVLRRRASLLDRVAYLQHTPECWGRRNEALAKLDLYEALRTMTVVSVLLHKLGRTKEDYMNEAAFKLGQLLAAADIVHAGYCADVRGGDVPPSLLGNQVFTMALSAPTKALAVLSRRWKPYDGWAKRAERQRPRTEALMGSQSQRGWDIKKALRCAREMRALAETLAPALDACTPDDAFRAELLLGYLAGIPKTRKGETNADHALQAED